MSSRGKHGSSGKGNQNNLPTIDGSDLMRQLERFNRSTLTPGTSARSKPKTLDYLFGTSLYRPLIPTQTMYVPHTSSGSENHNRTQNEPQREWKKTMENPRVDEEEGEEETQESLQLFRCHA